MLLNEEIEPKIANSLILACNAILSGIRTDEQERKITQLEQLLAKKDDD
jgi:hypothetical protein